MTQTLTLQDISCYLPYGLNVVRPDGKTILETKGIVANSYLFQKNVGSGYTYGSILSKSNKPILRPLSSLTIPITHKGETFVPIDFFQIGDEDNNFFEFDNGNAKIIALLTAISKYNTWHDVNYLPFAVVQKLIEWHFDVFGLISDGLAESVEELEINPYE